MKKICLVVLILMMVATTLVSCKSPPAQQTQQQFSAPAVPIEPADAEYIFTYGFNREKPIVVEIAKGAPQTSKQQRFDVSLSVRNTSSQTEEVIYCFQTSTPLSVGDWPVDEVQIDGKTGYQWGQKVPIAPNSVQIISVKFGGLPPPSSGNGTPFNIQVIRWVGPRG